MNTYSVKRIKNGEVGENGYLVQSDQKNVIIIDPGGNKDYFIEIIKDENLIPLAILNTHAHYDHIGAVEDLREHFEIPFYLHPLDKKLLGRANLYRTIFRCSKVVKIPKVNKFFEVGLDPLTIGEFSIKVIPTPGHTKGSVCLLFGNLLFSGDTLFKGKVGRTDFPESNFQEIQQSLKNLLKLSPDTIVYPGHGSKTSIGNEIKNISEIISA
jgi:Zn-dependent hydrolases, including glyoxylases